MISNDLRRQFASDNYAGICPEAWEALAEANRSHASGYGDDRWTQRAVELLRQLFETDCQVFFVFNGTSANSLALAALCQPYHAVLCHRAAHVETDECNAPGFFAGGLKVLTTEGPSGKLEPAGIEELVARGRSVHSSKPGAVSLTQATELGTVYTTDELKAVASCARANGLRVHMDGARFANAVASLGVSPKELTWQVGVDVLCLGGTKNGLAVGEAVVFFDRALADDFDYRRKQAGQLASKMRFVSAPWIGMLQDGAWLRHARHANAMAEKLQAAVREIPQVTVVYPCQANGVFVRLPEGTAEAMHERGWLFYDIGGCHRFMCAWDTTDEDIRAFVTDLREVVERSRCGASGRCVLPTSR